MSARRDWFMELSGDVERREACGCELHASTDDDGRGRRRGERVLLCPLHAAAPKLLAALKYVEQFGEAPLNYHVILKRVRAAIAEAQQ